MSREEIKSEYPSDRIHEKEMEYQQAYERKGQDVNSTAFQNLMLARRQEWIIEELDRLAGK